MTDKYGSDQEGHEGAADQEHEMPSETEAWQGDQPPVDDFADHASEETATVSEETEMHEEPVVAETEGKKKSIILPVAAAVGGLLIIGALLYWQFGGSSSSVTAQVPPPLKPMSSEPPMVADNSVANTKSAASPEQVNADISTLKSPQTADVSPTTALAPPSDVGAQAPIPPAIAMATAASAKVTPPPSQPAMPAPAPIASPQMPPSVTAPPASVPLQAQAPGSATSTPNSSLDTRLTVLATHVDDLQKSLNQAAQQLNQVSNMMAANANAATQTQSNSAIEDRLNKIEQQLMQMQHGTPTANSTSLASQEPNAVEGMTSTKSTMTASGHKHKIKHKVMQHEKTRASHKMAQKEKIIAPKMHWVLRAATPEQAWVATDSESPELRQVHVGDDLPGVGQIRAIHQNGDSWVLEGSEGSVQ